MNERKTFSLFDICLEEKSLCCIWDQSWDEVTYWFEMKFGVGKENQDCLIFLSYRCHNWMWTFASTKNMIYTHIVWN